MSIHEGGRQFQPLEELKKESLDNDQLRKGINDIIMTYGEKRTKSWEVGLKDKDIVEEIINKLKTLVG